MAEGSYRARITCAQEAGDLRIQDISEIVDRRTCSDFTPHPHPHDSERGAFCYAPFSQHHLILNTVPKSSSTGIADYTNLFTRVTYNSAERTVNQLIPAGCVSPKLNARPLRKRASLREPNSVIRYIQGNNSSQNLLPSINRTAIITPNRGSNVLQWCGTSRKLELKVFGSSIECIKCLSWSQCENLEGRRIVRLHKTLIGACLEVIFVPIRPSQYVNHLEFVEDDFLEISCIKFKNESENRAEFLITSAEVIKIIEYLIGAREGNSSFLGKDRGRIRSNLAPLWYKTISSVDKTKALRLRTQIQKYECRKPYNILKNMRMLSWDDLERAIRKALLFYHVLISDSSSPGHPTY